MTSVSCHWRLSSNSPSSRVFHDFTLQKWTGKVLFHYVVNQRNQTDRYTFYLCQLLILSAFPTVVKKIFAFFDWSVMADRGQSNAEFEGTKMKPPADFPSPDFTQVVYCIFSQFSYRLTGLISLLHWPINSAGFCTLEQTFVEIRPLRDPASTIFDCALCISQRCA